MNLGGGGLQMICPNCGSKVEDNYKFCPSCGSDLMSSDTSNDNAKKGYRCYKCGAFIPEYGSVCPNCGLVQNKSSGINNRLCALIIFFVFMIILFITGTGNSCSNKRTGTSTIRQTTVISLNECRDTLESQKRATDDIIKRYAEGEQTMTETIKDLNGLVFGIENTIDSIAKNPDNQQRSDLDQIAWCLRGYAKHYSDYLSGGNSRDLVDSQNLKESYDQYLDTYDQTY